MRWVQWEELCAPQLSRATQEGWLRTSHPWHTPAQALPSPCSTLYTQHPLPRSLLRALAIAAPFPAPPDTHTSGSHFTPQLLLPPWPCLLHQPQDAQHGWQCHEAAARLQKGAVKPPRLCLGQKRSCQGPGNGRDGCRITQTTPEDKWNNLMVLQLVCQGQHPERGPSPQGKITAIVHKASLPAASFPHHSYVWWLDLVILQVFSTLGDSLILWCSAHHTTWGSNRSMRRAWRYSWELRSVNELWECVPPKSPEENWSPQGKQQGYYLKFCIHICCG